MDGILSDLKASLAKAIPDARDPFDELLKRLKSPVLTLAVTGPSRSGKSTFINAILEIDICPTGDFPQTALPTLFEPGDEDSLEVLFLDGTSATEPANAQNLRKWVSYDENIDNKKGIRTVRVRLTKSKLNIGFSVVDLPGNDDPSEVIRATTELALEASDAIVYLLNGGELKIGSFMLRNEDRRFLQRLLSRKEKTFLVVNRSDLLDDESRERAQSFLVREFKRHHLEQLLGRRVEFISSQDAFAKRTLGKDVSDAEFARFESELFEFLVNNKRVGQNVVRGALSEGRELASEYLALLGVAIAKSEQLDRLQRTLDSFAPAAAQVRDTFARGLVTAQDEMVVAVRGQATEASTQFENYLRSIPPVQPLPDSSWAKTWVEGEVSRLVILARNQAQSSLVRTAQEAGAIVRGVMNTIQTETAGFLGQIGGVGISPVMAQSVDINLSRPFIGTVGLAAIGSLFGPIGTVVGAVVGLLLGWLVGEGEKRQRQISQQSQRVREILDEASRRVASAMDGPLQDAFSSSQDSLLKRLGESEQVMRRQVDSIGHVPSKEVEVAYRTTAAELKPILERAVRLAKDVSDVP